MRFMLPILAVLALASQSAAEDKRWTVVQAIGDVAIEQPGLSKIAVRPDAKVDEGATVTTGHNGRAVLTDGHSTITVNAASRIELPAADSDGMTAIRQDFGSALFQVQKKPTAHFEVETPYLAAVVKGTTFVVTVDVTGASVDVQEGLVDVSATLTGERTLVPGGQKVRVLRSGRFDAAQPASNGGGAAAGTTAAIISTEIKSAETAGAPKDAEFAALEPNFAGSVRTDLRSRADALETAPAAGDSDGHESADAPKSESGDHENASPSVRPEPEHDAGENSETDHAVKDPGTGGVATEKKDKTVADAGGENNPRETVNDAPGTGNGPANDESKLKKPNPSLENSRRPNLADLKKAYDNLKKHD